MADIVSSQEISENQFALKKWIEENAEENSESISRAKRNLMRAIQDDLTPKQQQYVLMYYYKGYSMEAIGKELGVDKSTVSRTISRGSARLQRALKYSF